MSKVVGLHGTADQEIIDKLEDLIDRVVKDGGRLLVGVVQAADGTLHPFYTGNPTEMLGALETVHHDILERWAPYGDDGGSDVR